MMALSKFLQAVVDKLPEAERPKATALFEAHPDALAAAADLDARLFEQSELEGWRGQLNDWKAKTETELAARAAKITAPADPTRTTRSESEPNNVIDRKTFDAALETVQSQGLALMSYIPVLVAKHYDTFKEVLDVQALMADPDANKIGLKALYERTFKARYDEKAKTAQEERDNKLRAEGRDAAMKEFAGVNTPYPVPRPGTSPIDQFVPGATKPDTAQYSVDAAVAEYNRLAALRPN